MERSELFGASELGSACREARQRLGLRLEDAALASGVNYRFASELENGKATARIELAIRYARSLGIRLFYQLPAQIAEAKRSRRSP